MRANASNWTFHGERFCFISVCSKITKNYAGLSSPANPLLSLIFLTVSKTSATLPQHPFTEVPSEKLHAFRDGPPLVGRWPTSPQLSEAFSKVPKIGKS